MDPTLRSPRVVSAIRQRGDALAAAAALAAHLATPALTLLARLDIDREPELLRAALAAVPGSDELVVSQEAR